MDHSILKTICSVGLILFYHSADGTKQQHQLKLHPNYTLNWEVVGNDYIHFHAIVQTSGYVGLALNTEPKMDGADLVMLGVKEGRPYIYNYYVVGHRPILEETAHWDIGYGRFFEADNTTFVNFVRHLDAGDKDGLAIEDKDMYLLWAYGEDDDVSKKHVARGVVRINLITPNITMTS